MMKIMTIWKDMLLTQFKYKMIMEKYVLTYAYCDCEDESLYNETIGIYDSLKEAQESMLEEIKYEFMEDSDDEIMDYDPMKDEEWSISDTVAESHSDYLVRRYAVDRITF